MEASISARVTVAVLSDVHYAAAGEQARGNDYELRSISHPLLRLLARIFRQIIWMRAPLNQGPQLVRFLQTIGPVDYVVANGDFSCDSGFVGVSDPATLQSAQECLGKLRARFGDRIHFTIGDHELGKLTLIGGRGGMRLASWVGSTKQLELKPFWQLTIGNYLLLGVASPLIALPANQPDTLPEEWADWSKLRAEHLAEIRATFDALKPEQRVLLFCHDPTALPFLWQEESVRSRLPQIEQTIIGHLHSNLILWKSRLLAGMPPIGFLGQGVQRLSRGLNEARLWRPFRVRLCPSLAGIELVKRGTYCTIKLDPEAQTPISFRSHPLDRRPG